MPAKFDYDDVVVVKGGELDAVRIGSKAWIVGVFEQRPAGGYFDKFPPGVVYTVEFDDGFSTEVHEDKLSKFLSL